MFPINNDFINDEVIELRKERDQLLKENEELKKTLVEATSRGNKLFKDKEELLNELKEARSTIWVAMSSEEPSEYKNRLLQECHHIDTLITKHSNKT